MSDLEKRIETLIDETFAWGRSAFPNRPSTSGSRRLAVERWLEAETRPFHNLALGLVARVEVVFRERELLVRRQEGHRLFARVDPSALTKSPASILDKMARLWEAQCSKEGREVAPPVDFLSFRHEIDDLGRFRIVANFLSDAEEIAACLEEPFQSVAGQEHTEAQRLLAHEFALESNHFERSLHLLRSDSGERSCKGHFYPRGQPSRRIEVQIQTQLQEAWDKKDHYLVYEPRRRFETVDPMHQSEMGAMSALLYVADRAFDRLRREMLAARGEKKGSHAPAP